MYVDAPRWASGIQNRVGGSVARYCRMSGLSMRRCLAAGPYGVREIGSKSCKRAQRPFTQGWFFRSRLVDRLPLPVPASCYPHLPDSFFALGFSPFTARSGGGANPVGLLSRRQCPDPPRHPVGERHRDHLLRLACQHPGQLSMAIENMTLPAVENGTLIGTRRGATGAERSERIWSARITEFPRVPSAPPRPPGRRSGGWPWRVPDGVASGSCCPGC